MLTPDATLNGMLLNLPRSDQKKGGRSKCVELILIRLGSYRIYEKTQLTHVHCRNIRIVLKHKHIQVALKEKGKKKKKKKGSIYTN